MSATGFTPLFVVGSRRSGTFWLQRTVCAHPDVAEVPSETFLYSDGVEPLLERFRHDDPASREVGSIYMPREELIAAVRGLCEAALATFHAGEGYVAERTPFHVRHIPLIAEIHPDARFLHIVRDGRDVARSLRAQPWGPDSIGAAAAEWQQAVAAGRAAGLPADRLREVRYERAIADPGTAVAELVGWLGLDHGDPSRQAMLEAAGTEVNLGSAAEGVGSGKWRDSWGAEELAEFDAVAGGLLAELGYE